MIISQPIATVLAAIVLLVGGAFAYHFQRLRDRKEALIDGRREIYRDLIGALFDIGVDRSKENLVKYDKKKNEAVLIGSDHVVRRLFAVHEDLVMSEAGPDEELVANLVTAMRKDCFEKSDVDNARVAYLMSMQGGVPKNGSTEGHFEPPEG